ncbi:hypothetical protein DPM33_34485 [Mesorhizobium hawassense]|uniref:Glycosyltransferase 2-like domain-containing protein n=2 Tax=Mesorhizobium hawassense TaxID=1209954 RepID=A0A330H4N6_9HYPH|nr:hypothetical protein DPM33_34485 [Mesorhizobium hawassense]
MTAYTDQRFLDAAVDSILTQEFSDLELIIVDDASGFGEVFEALARRDPRIRILTNLTNRGTAAAANRGIAAARGDIIVRLDSDDIAEPAHVARLVAALDEDSELGLVGSAVTLIDEADRVVGAQPMPETDLEIRWTILFHCPFYHSAVAYRKSLFEAAGTYRVHELVSQDHYLWYDMLPLCRARNLAEPLTRYRVNTQGLTVANATNARHRTHPIREASWARLGLAYDLYDDAFARDLTDFIRGTDISVERRAEAYRKLLEVLRAFLARSGPFERADDAAAARKLEGQIMARMLARPPLRLEEASKRVEPPDGTRAGTMDADFASWFDGKVLSTDWTSRFFPVWATLLAARREEPLDVLEIGSWEGRSAIFFLRYLASCRLTCIDSFEGSAEHALRLKWSNQLAHIEQRFDFNLAEFQGRFEKLKAMSSAALAGLIAERRRFDLIYIDGSHHSADVLADAVASWQLIDKDGLIIFDDYEWAFFADEANRPKLGVDTFLAGHKGEYRELYRGEQVIIQKTVPLEAASPRAERPATLAKSLPDSPAKSVEFVLIAEAGVLEAQALLLCESIRAFAGSYSQCPIIVVSPRSDRRPSASTLKKLEQLGVEYLPLDIDSCCPQYAPSYKVHSLAYVERRPGPPVIVQLDSDAIFIGEPVLLLESCEAAARPVDSKGMCTTGPGDPFDPYWRDLCQLAGVDYEHLPVVWTSDGAAVVRASYNGGLIAARRSCGLFQRTEDIFRQLVAAELKPWRTDQPTYRTGTGLQSGEATAFWGTSQAAFSLAAVAGNHAVRHLPATHNFPLHNLAGTKAPDPAKLVHIHYHGLFSAGSDEANPIFDGRLDLPAGIAEWLQARLPLREEPQPADEKAGSAHSKRKTILILGMHRSGTSILGGMVNALGAAGPHSLMAADSHNPTGYWESLRLNAATNDLLAAAGSGWHDWLPLDPDWMASGAARGHRHKIKGILASEFGDEALFFIKEPRICRFLPWMSSILAEMRIDTVALLPIRNPLEVAHSIERRDGFPVAGSLLVWLRHVLDAELHSRHMPRCFMLHEDLLADWQGQLTRAGRAIDLAWPIRPGQARSEVESFLSQELHHERCTIDDLRNHPDAPPVVVDAYAILRAMASDGDSQGLRDQLDEIRVRLDGAAALVGRAFAAERSVARRSADDLQGRLTEFHTQAEQLHALVAELHRDRDAALGDRDRLRRENQDLSGEREALLRERDALHREREALYREREGLVKAREAMLASHSWRLTAPLRWLRNPFAKRGAR